VNSFDSYFDALFSRLHALRDGSGSTIREGARLCAEAIDEGGVVHIYDTGHLVSRELVNRAGGLAAVLPFAFTLTVENPVLPRQQAPHVRGDERGIRQLIEAAIARSNLRAGDVLIIGSVSGNSAAVVELCQQAQELKLATIAVTAVEYSKNLVARHRSGKKLFETADLVIDNGAPFGDAILQIEGLDEPCCPFSGIGAVVSLWALVAATCEILVEAGSAPTVFPSINRPDGPERYEEAKQRFAELGR